MIYDIDRISFLETKNISVFTFILLVVYIYACMQI